MTNPAPLDAGTTGGPARDRYVDVRALSKSFSGRGSAEGTRVEVLEDIRLSIGRHEMVSVVGPSGSGKTTLLRLMAGLERPDAGSVWIDGAEVKSPGPDRAVVFQQAALLPWASAIDNVCLGLRMRGMARNESRKRAMSALELVGVADFASSLPGELSGGMQQRVALARALVLDPSVMLLDEPFANLDEITRRRLQAELMGLWERAPRAGFFITHNVDEAILVADRVAIMSPRPGRVHELFDVPLPRPRTLDVERSPEFLAARAHVWEVIEKWPS
jgi:ABC-type nitrate/sulfonate/bicarbonate transport system ATPase subunit